MNNRNRTEYWSGDARGRRRRAPAAAILGGLLVSMLSGCGAEDAGGTVQSFLQDFARQVLAAWML